MRRRPVGVLAVTVASSMVLAGCTLPWSGPDPKPALESWVKALEKGKPQDAPWAKPTMAIEYERVTAGLGSTKPRLSIGEIKTEGESGRATVTWTWDVGAKPWRYRSEVPLMRKGETWTIGYNDATVNPKLKREQSLSLSLVPAKRGDITGAGNATLVTDRPVLRIGIDKTNVGAGAAAASAQRLARLLDVSVDSYAKTVEKSGPKQFVPLIIMRTADLSPQQRAAMDAIPGAVALASTRPLAPSRDFAGDMLGSVSEATAEIIKKSKGKIKAGQLTGISGLQSRYDDQLGGTPGYEISIHDAKGGEVKKIHAVAPAAGKPLATTLNPKMQRLADRVTRDINGTGALVALQPSTGNVLAVAGTGSRGYGTATVGQYPPGSTFKIVTALALLRAGVKPTDRVTCSPTLSVNGKTFKNYSDYPSTGLGQVPFATAFANSCNTAFISERAKLGPNALSDAAQSLGLGKDYDVGFPAYFGQVKPAAGATQAAANMIGQGKVLAAPLTMAAVTASVLAGKTVVPRLVESSKAQKANPAKPLTAGEARALRELMRAVVARGSGKQLANVPGPPVLAKTGTAEFGRALPLDTHAWMVAGQGDLAVAVFAERGKSGSSTAGPILKAFLEGAR